MGFADFIYFDLTYILSGAIMPFYMALLYRVYNGSQFKYIKQIGWLFLACAVAAIPSVALYQPNQSTISFFSQSISIFVRDSCFNVANWVFSFKYYKISVVMPLMLDGIQVPDELVTKIQRINNSMIALNVFIPIVQIAGYITYDLTNRFALIATVSRLSISLLKVVSACFLGIGINRIRKQANSKAATDKINVPQLI